MARITLAELSANEVELPGDHVYTVTPATKSVMAAGEQIDERLDALKENDIPGLVAVYGELLDLRLQPAEKGQHRASVVMKRLWETDKITLPQVEQLLRSISATDRPT